MNWLVSINRSTQLTKHISVLESSFGPGLSIHLSWRQRDKLKQCATNDASFITNSIHHSYQKWCNTLNIKKGLSCISAFPQHLSLSILYCTKTLQLLTRGSSNINWRKTRLFLIGFASNNVRDIHLIIFTNISHKRVNLYG